MALIGKAAVLREGRDIDKFNPGVGGHGAVEAAEKLEEKGASAAVVDLITVAPLDKETASRIAQKTGRVLVTDEEYANIGLSGEIAAIIIKAGCKVRSARVCT